MDPWFTAMLTFANIVLFAMLASMTINDYHRRHEIGSSSYKFGIVTMIFILILDFLTIVLNR